MFTNDRFPRWGQAKTEAVLEQLSSVPDVGEAIDAGDAADCDAE